MMKAYGGGSLSSSFSLSTDGDEAWEFGVGREGGGGGGRSRCLKGKGNRGEGPFLSLNAFIKRVTNAL